MSTTEQGVLNKGKLSRSLAYLLQLLIFLLPQIIYADSDPNTISQENRDKPREFHLALMYSPESTLQSEIAELLSRTLTNNQSIIRISTITDSSNNSSGNIAADLIVAIGLNNIQSANENFTKTDKLLIASDPGEFNENTNTGIQSAVLYMTQPYCRQIQFIKLIDSQWHTFSYFSNGNTPADDLALKQCAIKYNIRPYKVNVTDTDRLTNDIKNALKHSDLILAIPDKDIFNSRTVKNILLTSYRYRKPVIAFSKNFVNAGALAAIHSNTDQIAKSAGTIIEQYISNDQKFIKSVNYPKLFELDINRQVFRALNLDIPDIDEIKQVIENSDAESTR
jgi:hypothetical protein